MARYSSKLKTGESIRLARFTVLLLLSLGCAQQTPEPPLLAEIHGSRAAGSAGLLFDREMPPKFRVAPSFAGEVSLRDRAGAWRTATVEARSSQPFVFLEVTGPELDTKPPVEVRITDGRGSRSWPIIWGRPPADCTAVSPQCPLADAWNARTKGSVAWREGNVEGARQGWREAAEKATAAGYASYASQRWRGLAFEALQRWDYPAAELALERAEQLTVRDEDRSGLAYYRGLLAELLGQFRQAEQSLLSAIDGELSWGRAEAASDHRLALGLLLARMGRHADALQSIDRYASTSEHPGRWAHAAAWALLQSEPGDSTDDLVYELLAIAFSGFIDTDVAEAAGVAVEQAELWVQQGQPERALARLQASSDYRSEAAGHAHTAWALIQARAEIESGEAGAALIRAERLMHHTENRETSDGTWRAQMVAASALDRLGESAQAAVVLAEARATFRRSARLVDLRQSRASFVSDRLSLFETSVALAMRQGRIAEAFALSDESLALVFQDLQSRVALTQRGAGHDGWTQQVATWAAARGAVEASLRARDLVAEAGILAWTSQHRDLVIERDEAFDTLGDWVDARTPTRWTPGSTRSVQAALRHGEALVLEALGWTFLVTPKRLKARPSRPDPLRVWQAELTDTEHVYAVGFDPGIRPNGSVSRLPFAGLLRRAAPPSGDSILVVSDPDGDLPGARLEGFAVASRFDAPLLVGAEASRAAVLARLASAKVFHFAGHGHVNPDDPWSTHLKLANGTSLAVTDLISQPMGASLVVLSGCRTGSVAQLGGRFGISLPQAFLAAGARSVVATSDKIDDALARQVAEVFYEAGGNRKPGAGVAAVHRSIPETRGLIHLWGRP